VIYERYLKKKLLDILINFDKKRIKMAKKKKAAKKKKRR